MLIESSSNHNVFLILYFCHLDIKRNRKPFRGGSMDSLGYPIMPNFGGEATDNSLGSAGAVSSYSTDTSTASHNTDPVYTDGDFSAQGRSDISVILNQLMTITDQVIWIRFLSIVI